MLAPVLGEKISAATISRIARGLDDEVIVYHSRPLKDQYRYLFLDGVVLKSKGAVKVQKKILLCAFGITAEGKQGLSISMRQPVNLSLLGSAIERSISKRVKGEFMRADRHRWGYRAACSLTDRVSQEPAAALLGS